MTDMACLWGSLYGAIKPKFPYVRYRGIDIEEKALAIGRKKFPEAEFLRRNVFTDELDFGPTDLVTSFDFFTFGMIGKSYFESIES
jgi:hypothetical protein